MKQYCRYCGFCIDADSYYCTDQNKFLSEASIKTANRCSKYGYCGIDVITGNDHEPKERKNRVQKIEDGEQLQLI